MKLDNIHKIDRISSVYLFVRSAVNAAEMKYAYDNKLLWSIKLASTRLSISSCRMVYWNIMHTRENMYVLCKN